MSGMTATVRHGDCIEVMRGMDEASVDAIVTDPPYGLGFMGKAWDALPPGKEWAEECWRVLKPGGHLLAFGGTRTWHRLAVSIEDAGFEIRDSIAWLYSSGFPKSQDVSKAIDKLDAAGERLARAREFQTWLGQHLTPIQINQITGTGMGHKLTTHPTQPAVATAEIFDKLRPYLGEVPARIESLVAQRTVESQNFKAREVIGTRRQRANSAVSLVPMNASVGEVESITAPLTPAAQQWEGWGTALKPAFEPAVFARKPVVGTVAANVVERGTGAINISASRVGARFPANVIFDESQSAALEDARYFYCAKAPKSERPIVDGVAHPTVKPLSLMRYLVKLVTPPGGVVLDPFAGSGTTLEAATLEGFQAIGIEAEAAYLPLIEQRLGRAA